MHRTTLLALWAVGGLISAAVAAVPPVQSCFDRGNDGWVIRDLNCNNYAQVVGGGSIAWLPVGGDPGGFLRSTDPSGNCYAYEAPSTYLGDRSAYLGGSLGWSIRTNVADWTPGSVLILIGGGLTLVSDVPQPSTGVWVDYAVGLDAGSFRVNNAAGAPATSAQMATVLGNLTAIRISAEFGSEAGEETVDLDTVVLRGPCPADLDGDGAVGAADLTVLLAAWGTGCAPADLDRDGVVAASDLTVLLAAWGPC